MSIKVIYISLREVEFEKGLGFMFSVNEKWYDLDNFYYVIKLC